MRYVKPLAEVGLADLSIAGGKGASLGDLLDAGEQVPPGFCLTTEAYEDFSQTAGLGRVIDEAMAGLDASDAKALQEASERIGAAFSTGEVPAAIAEEAVEAYQALGSPPVAVRSSATAEDLPEASFAGQHATYLNIVSADGLLDAVKGCWASLWSAAAIQYRTRQGLAAAVSMAVVVQRMLAPRASGALFTADPMTGVRDRIVINASYGLGEAIVSGEVTPDVYRVRKNADFLEAKAISRKSAMTVALKEGGTGEEAVPTSIADAAALADDEALAMAETGWRVEARRGMPLDIEWSLTDEGLYLLQARPLTALPVEPEEANPWNNPVPGAKWRRNWRVGEWLSDPVTPLFSTLLLPVLVAGREEQGFNHLGWNQPKAFAMPQPWYCIINGYFFTRMDPPIRGGGPMQQDILERSRMMTDRKEWLEGWAREHLPRYEERLAGFAALEAASASSEEVLGLLDELARDAGEWWYLQAPIGYGFEDLFFGGFYNERFSDPGRPPQSAFFSGYDSLPLQGQRKLHELAGEIRASDALRQALEHAVATRSIGPLSAIPEGARLVSELEGLWRSHGHQIFSFDFYFPTLAEQPELTLGLLQTYARESPRDPALTLADQARKREEAVAYAKEELAHWPKEEAEAFTKLLEWHQLCASLREDIAFHQQRLWPIMRGAILELGRRLKEGGALPEGDLAFFLHRDELRSALQEQEAPAEGLGAVAQERRSRWEEQRGLAPPDRIPPPDNPVWQEGMARMLEHYGPGEEDGRRVLRGHGASPGRVTAPARVLRSPADLGSFRKGEVLITPAAGPAWTTLFGLAAAVVTEIGGGATHSSMVAREYGIPAVMGTGVAAREIKTGQTVTVDGTEGVVYLE